MATEYSPHDDIIDLSAAEEMCLGRNLARVRDRFIQPGLGQLGGFIVNFSTFPTRKPGGEQLAHCMVRSCTVACIFKVEPRGLLVIQSNEIAGRCDVMQAVLDFVEPIDADPLNSDTLAIE